MKKHPLYDTYRSMLGRCYYKEGPSYKNYGGKGVYVCARWRGRRVGFQNFIADMGPKPTPQHTLERDDRNGPYSPENCRWATRREQLLNTSRTRTFERDGVLYKAAEIAAEYGIANRVVIDRAAAGLPFDQIVSRHHLDPHRDHMAEMIKKSAELNYARTHCKNGHELTPENTLSRRGQPKWRGCKRCNADAQNRYRKRKEQALSS